MAMSTGNGYVEYIAKSSITKEGRALAKSLMALRIGAGITLPQLSEMRHTSIQTLRRYEMGNAIPGHYALTMFLVQCNASDEQTDRINGLWMTALRSYEPLRKMRMAALKLKAQAEERQAQPDPALAGIRKDVVLRFIQEGKVALTQLNAQFDAILTEIGATSAIENRQAKRFKRLADGVPENRKDEFDDWIGMIEDEFGVKRETAS